MENIRFEGVDLTSDYHPEPVPVKLADCKLRRSTVHATAHLDCKFDGGHASLVSMNPLVPLNLQYTTLNRALRTLVRSQLVADTVYWVYMDGTGTISRIVRID